MTSRAATLANAVVTALSTWEDLPSGMEVVRTRSITRLIAGLTTEAPGIVAVMVSRRQDDSKRGDVSEQVTLGIVIIGNCESSAVTVSDPWDQLTEDLYDHLRESTSFKVVQVATGVYGQRMTVENTVPCDAEIIDQDEVFVSAVEATWLVSKGNR
jgi:hypothetical protein